MNIPATGWYETMGGLPAVWADWNTTDAAGNLLDLSQRRDTYYYTDADGQRVYGTAKNHLTDEEAARYTVANVLSGADSWQPVTKTEACAAPAPVADGNELSWAAVPYAICYVVTDGDRLAGIVAETSISVDRAATSAEGYAVQAVNEFGGLSAKGYVRPVQGAPDIEAASDYHIVAVYDIHGHRLSEPVPGVNIVCLADTNGNTRVEKMIVR